MRIQFLADRRARRAFNQLTREVPLGVVFEKFHELLEYNNRVLEIIADIEELLEGEYIFDRNFIHCVCEELSSILSRIVYNLNVVGRGEYFQLFEIYENIRQKIEWELLDHFPLPEGDYVIPFKYLDQSKSNLSGNKAAVLGELKPNLKIPVPPGFVITTRAYERFLESEGLERKIERLLEPVEKGLAVSLEELAFQIEDAIVNATMPGVVAAEIEEALDQLAQEWGRDEIRYAVRSSAVGEDAQLSFAGQYSTFLNVLREDIVSSYKKVVASLFCSNALTYRKENRISHSQTPMAVAVMPMLNPLCSGVMYSVDPNLLKSGNMIVSAKGGFGQTGDEAEGTSDYYVVTRRKPHAVIESSVAGHREADRLRRGRKVAQTAALGTKKDEQFLSEAHLSQLAELALRIEEYFGRPQDIEWALDADGDLSILQARPLLTCDELINEEKETPSIDGTHPVLMKTEGTVACRGVATGTAYHIYPSDSGVNFPEGGVLVARATSPRFSALLARASAVITDIGTPTGHMATIAREFRVPMIVDTGMGTRLIPHGAEVTVDANKNVIYSGSVKELTRMSRFRKDPLLNSAEFRKLHRILNHVAPLHLVDPRDATTFQASECRSYHDIIRYSHEMVVKELIDMNLIRKRQSKSTTRRLTYSLPIGLILIDVGGGLGEGMGKSAATIEHLKCVPLRSILQGLLVPGMWSTRPVPLSFRDFISGVSHTIDPMLSQSEYGSRSLAVISDSYVNLSLRFGYHFTMVDCVASEKRNANYIYFRFVGGITEMARRKRRAEFLLKVLNSYDFNVSVKGDLVIARLGKLSLPMMQDRLFMIGCLIGFSRQLDIVMRTEDTVEHYAGTFLNRVREQFDRQPIS